MRARVARFAVRRPLGTVIGCVLLLGAAAVGLVRYDVGNPVIQSLPAAAGPQRAYDVAPGGDLARFLVVFEGDPLDGPAVDALHTLQDRAPALLREAGLEGAELLLGGDTAITANLIDRTMQDLVRVAPVALLGAFLVLALYLRSLVAPLCMIVTSVLALLVLLGARDWRPGRRHGIQSR